MVAPYDDPGHQNMKHRNFIVAILAVAAASACASARRTESHASAQGASPLDWLAGTWRADNADGFVEESWSPAAGNVQFAWGRTVSAGRTVFFEFLRIEPRNGGFVYIAQPMGVAPTTFKSTFVNNNKVVFENPEHDMPNKITYELGDDGRLRARIDGIQNGRAATEQWIYQKRDN